MNTIVGTSWSGNKMIYSPSKRNWEPDKGQQSEEATAEHLQEANEITLQRSYLIMDIKLEAR